MKVAIAGGGIGGLTLAGLLNQSGHEVVLVERAPEFGEVGAGVLISANGSRVLAKLGLSEQLRKFGTISEQMVIRRWQNDQEIMNVPFGDGPEKRWGFPNYTLYRPDLIGMLSTAIDGVDLRMGTEVIGASSDNEGGSLKLASGEVIEADIVVGADGTHSSIRTSMFGEHPSRYSGYVAYRAIVPQEAVRDLPVDTTSRLGPDRHVVSYFIGEKQRLLNLVFIAPEKDWVDECWTAPGSLSELSSHFEGWSPGLQGVLGKVEEPVYRWALHDRVPLSCWTRGRVTLLGDAAHPVVPFMAQGACQAIEDAAMLSRILEDSTIRPEDALTKYELIRKPRTDMIQNGSWGNATTLHFDDGPEQEERDAFYAAVVAEGDNALAAMDWLHGYDVLSEAV